MAQDVEEAVRATGSAEIASHDVGMAILGPLRSLDEIAYLRLRDESPDFIRELMAPDAMVIPPRLQEGQVARPAQAGRPALRLLAVDQRFDAWLSKQN